MALYGFAFARASIPRQVEPNTPENPRKESTAGKYPIEGARQPSRIDGEAIAFATVLGAALPSIALFRYSRPSVTVLWQAFPLYIFLARIGYQCLATSLFHRPASHAAPRNVQSSPVKGGYQFIRVTLLTSFALSTYFHIAFVMSTLRTGLPPSASFPSLTVLSWAEPGSVDFVSLNALIFLLWDFIFSSISTLAALALDAIAAGKSVAKSKWTIVGCLLGCVLVGPGAILSICVLWREDRLKKGVGSL